LGQSAWLLAQHTSIFGVDICNYHDIFLLSARQDEMDTKRMKLDYEEITPCLKDVTTVWDGMIHTPNKANIKFDSNKLLDAVKHGEYSTGRGPKGPPAGIHPIVDMCLCPTPSAGDFLTPSTGSPSKSYP
jgi:hypothetical protein